MFRIARSTVPTVILLAAAAGCGARAEHAALSGKILPVKGVVTYKGKPLTQGTVRFEPDAGREAEGTIGPDGTFTLTTFQPGDGAVPGFHRVAVSTPRKKQIPSKYSSFSMSGIEMEVNEEKAEYIISLK